jgi:hypothetical protein
MGAWAWRDGAKTPSENWEGEPPASLVDGPAPVGSGGLEGASVPLVSSSSRAETNCAVQADELYCWGNGYSGQLGNGSRFVSFVTPVKVDMTGAMAGTAALAGTDAYSRLPVAIDTSGVLAGKTVTDVAVHIGSACVIAEDEPFCWGYGYGPDGHEQFGKPLFTETASGRPGSGTRTYDPVVVGLAGYRRGHGAYSKDSRTSCSAVLRCPPSRGCCQGPLRNEASHGRGNTSTVPRTRH